MRAPYLARRDGRYLFRARWPACLAPPRGSASLRIALRTADFRVALRRSARLLAWFLPMKAAPDPVDALQALAPRLFQLAVEPIVSDEQYVEAEAFRLAVMRACLAAARAGVELDAVAPGFSEHLLVFQREYIRAYGEREAAKSVAGRLAARRRELALAGGEAAAPPLAPPPTAAPPCAPPATAVATPVGGEAPPDRRLSALLARFLAYKRQEAGDGRAESDVAPIVRFAIAFWGDPLIHAITPEQIVDLKQALPEIPTPRGFTQAERADLHFRYRAARDGDWRRVVGGEAIRLKRPSVATLKSRYRLGLDAFFGWAVEHKFMAAPAPDFAFVARRNPGKQKRDAFQPEELIALLSTPAFTGCASLARCWEPGDHLHQSVFYWALLICVFAGLRPGEIAQLRCRDLQPLYDRLHFRFARSDAADGADDEGAAPAKQAKSDNAFRWAPVHPLLIRLGLVARRDAIVAAEKARRLRAAGGRAALSPAQIEAIEDAAQDAWLFPDWKVYVRKTGVIQWSQALTKVWQYAQQKHQLTRRGLTLYSARHTYKGFIDDLHGLSERSRRVLMGHSTEENVPQQYGPKRITEAQMEVVLNLSNETIEQAAAILIAAKERAERGELKVIEAWRNDLRADDAAFQAALAARADWRP